MAKQKHDNSVLVRNLLFHHEASRILKITKKEKLKTIVLKGFALARIIKASFGQRAQCDIDLLIKKSDFKKIKKILERQTYKIDRKNKPINLKQELKCLGEITFTKNYPKLKSKVKIDLHLSPFLPSEWEFKLGKEKVTLFTLAEKKIITNDFFKRAVWIEDGLQYWGLSNEDALLHLCLHAYFHHDCRYPRLFKEISQFTKINQINWSIIKKRAKKYKIGKYIYYPLLLAKQLFKAEVTQETLNHFKPKSLLSQMVPLFINQKNVFRLYKRQDFQIYGAREKAILAFLLLGKPFFWKLRYLIKPSALTKYSRFLPLIKKSLSQNKVQISNVP